MSDTHAHLHLPRTSPVHRINPAPKVLGTVAFVIAVALTPRTAWWAFAIDAAMIAIVIITAQLPLRQLVPRLMVVAPFLTFALIVPVVAGGPTVHIGPVELSQPGLWAAFNVTVKSVLGAMASIVLTATTPVPDIIAGLGRLRLPTVVVSIIAFMFRYLDLLTDELHRMRQAMAARGHDPRWLWQAKPIAQSAGTVFVRTYERGERVHLAMLARGFTGRLPELGSTSSQPTTALATGCALAPAAIAAVVAAVAGLR